MWKDLDPNKITSNVCMQCAACCKHTVEYLEQTRKYAEMKLEYLMAIHDKPREDFRLEERRKPGKWRVLATFKCKQLLPDNGCKIYKKRPAVCDKYNCITTANEKEEPPQNWEVIKDLVD